MRISDWSSDGCSSDLAYRKGDANMRSVWICSRNDAIANVAVVLAALGVFGTGTGWPAVVVAAVIAGLSLWGAAQIIRQARAELRDLAASGRSEEPRVGEEWVRACQSRGWA